MGEERKSVSLQCSFPGINFQQRPCRAVLYGGARKDKIVICLGE